MIAYIESANHPGVCLTTICFKLASPVSYLLLNIFLNSTSMVYLVVILSAAFDFWVTKNISGRKLVGLRWWNEVKDDGTEVWIFESKNEKKESNADYYIFWSCVYGSVVVWVSFTIWQIIKFSVWAVLAFVCLIFAFTNAYGFHKCSKKQQENVGKLGAKAALKIVDKGVDIAKSSA